jgi:hypothetical protein
MRGHRITFRWSLRAIDYPFTRNTYRRAHRHYSAFQSFLAPLTWCSQHHSGFCGWYSNHNDSIDWARIQVKLLRHPYVSSTFSYYSFARFSNSLWMQPGMQ